MEQNGLVRLGAVVIVPVQKGAGRTTGQLKNVHPQQAGNINLARARNQRLAHYAHKSAGHYPKELLKRSPALYCGTVKFGFFYPLVHHVTKFCHLQKFVGGYRFGRYVFLDSIQFSLNPPIVITK